MGSQSLLVSVKGESIFPEKNSLEPCLGILVSDML